jgi:hypothetical protein
MSFMEDPFLKLDCFWLLRYAIQKFNTMQQTKCDNQLQLFIQDTTASPTPGAAAATGGTGKEKDTQR